MGGTLAGGKKAAATNKARHGEDFYRRLGRMGGKNGHTGGFASNKIGKDGLTGLERAKIAGEKGGTISKRGRAKKHSRKKVVVTYEETPESQIAVAQEKAMSGLAKILKRLGRKS